jgi:Dolichyl-phosphate-mannose-protein mannosyltransferase
MKKHVAIAILLTIAGLGFRLFVALHLPTDEPDDGRLYARIALNVLEHRTYSIETEEPYSPTLIRVPGYPLFLAGLYEVFGRDNNRAVRIVQAVLDTITCWLIALLALAWAPAGWRLDKRRRLLLIAVAMAICCPFPAIYVATILTETCTTLLATLCALAATLAMNAKSRAKSAGWWILAGFSGGLATMFRPDSGLFVAAVGCTLVLVGLYRAIARWRSRSDDPSEVWGGEPGRVIARTFVFGVMLTIGFALAMGPWTIRNARVFGLFQPIAPAQANMPGEFVPRGYIQWLKTWVDDVKYTETLEWGLDALPIHIEQMPEYAFDSPEERDRVAALLERYNNPPSATSQPISAGTNAPDSKADSRNKVAVVEPELPEEETAEEPETPEDGEDTPDEPEETKQAVEMTPEVDAGFAELARERIARHPLRFYLLVPLKRATGLWFDTHSQYYPFQGELLPLAALDIDIHQQYWLPLFMFLTLLYTSLGVGGVWVMWNDKQSRRCLLLLGLLIIPRFAFLTTMENPEPRYVVEFFAFVVAVGSLSLTDLWDRLLRISRAWRRPAEQKES